MTQTIQGKTNTLPFFRNPKNMIWYLQRRPDQQPSESNFLLGPNQTVQALDEAEAMLLASMGLIDIAKDTPMITNSLDTLKKELEAEKAKNATLMAQNQALKAGKFEKVVPESSKKR